jgi:antitoxin HicB
MKTYPAIIAWSESDKVFEVEFPDIPGCFTYGETLEDAKAQAADVLALMLEDAESFPAALPRSGPDVHEIELDSSLVFAIWLRSMRRTSGMTLTDVADKLGVKYQVYQRLEDPTKTNPTLKTISKLEKVFGSRLIAV